MGKVARLAPGFLLLALAGRLSHAVGTIVELRLRNRSRGALLTHFRTFQFVR
jgi:hypothetical protein